VQVLSNTIESVSSQSIRDCYRLGKYTQYDRPRPLVAVLSRTVDVSEILANRGNLRHPYYIKPDMNPEERAVESLLLAWTGRMFIHPRTGFTLNTKW